MPRLSFAHNSSHSQRYRHTSDKDLIAACLRADAVAWDTLIDRYAALIYSLCHRMGLSSADTEDVFQDICVLLLNHLADLRDTTKLASWLISTTKREIWRSQRRCGAVLSSELGEGAWMMESAEGVFTQQPGSPEADVIAVEREQLMREALMRLPDRCRQMLMQLYGNDTPLSYTDIAAQFSLPLGSIGPTRARCLQNLRKLLKDLDY